MCSAVKGEADGHGLAMDEDEGDGEPNSGKNDSLSCEELRKVLYFEVIAKVSESYLIKSEYICIVLWGCFSVIGS